MPGQSLTPLIDKETVFIDGFWGNAILFDIELEQLSCPGFELYEPEPFALAQDGHGFLLRVKIVKVQIRDCTGPGP